MRRSAGPVAASRVLVSIALAAAQAGCSDQPAHVTLVPLGGDCARPDMANAVKITAFTGSGEQSESISLDETVAIGDFPADTEQIGVEVIVGGGVVGAAGKSAPLDFAGLPDGAKIPVLMGPVDGFCPIAMMHEARMQPLVARAGNGVLIVGGTGPDGPLSTAEYFDPATATFAPVAVPRGLDDARGFTGAALATLPDGRVALTGGPNHAFIVFDPAARAFVTQPVVIEIRSFHASIASGPDEVLVAGGCTTVDTTCGAALPRRQMLRYQLQNLDLPDAVVQLPVADELRLDARLFDLGVQLDGAERFLLAGGSELSGAAGAAERFALADDQATPLPGGLAQAVALDGGAVLTAFASDAAGADSSAAVYAPDGAAAQAVARAPASIGMRLIGLEDGRVVGFGSRTDSMANVLLSAVIYDPTRDGWLMRSAPPGAPEPLSAPSLARLADGSVLVVGGSMSAQAWLYRPSLVGPASGSVTVIPAGDDASGVLTAPDPATVARPMQPAAWSLSTANGQAMARALVGGPRMTTGSVSATVHVAAGGVGLIAQQVGPGQVIMGELIPGQPALLVKLAGGTRQVLCSGLAVSVFTAGAPVVAALTISSTGARLSLGGMDVLDCGVALADRGAWGIASLGAGASITVDSVTVAR